MWQMSREQLDGYQAGKIKELAEAVRPMLDHKAELYRRYKRKTGNHQMMHGAAEGSGTRAIVAFEYYIVNMVQGYLGGKAPMYSIRGNREKKGYAEQYKGAIEHIRRYNDDAATYIELLHDYLITTSAYLYVQEDEYNEIRYVQFDSGQTAAIFDYSTPPRQIGCIRMWKETSASGEDLDVIELITKSSRTVYRQDGDNFSVADVEPLNWDDDIPCVAFENPDGIAVFEPAISPIDTYEQLVNNVRNMTQYNDDAKLLVSGYEPEFEAGTKEREEADKNWLSSPTLFVGENGTISWLLKNVDYSGTLSVEQSLHDLITMLTGVPNLTDEAFSNADNASALGYKLYALDQYSATTDRVFKKGYQRLWEIITSRLNLKGGGFDFRDIDITMQRNIPTDKDKSIARAAQMKQSGLFSDETSINESSVEVDAKEEIERRDAEEQEDFERIRARSGAGDDVGNDEKEPQ